MGAILYRFPSRQIKVVGVTGTKGKSTTVELVSAILEEAGYSVAISSTIHFKIADKDMRNMYKMTMPGRFFIQKFLRAAVKEGCEFAVVEMTSEGVKQFRHAGIALDALIFLNLSPEHIESHGSFENYRRAKLRLADALEESSKPDRTLVVNGDDKTSEYFLKRHIPRKVKFHLRDAGAYTTSETGSKFLWRGASVLFHLAGVFNIKNALAAASFAESQDIPPEVVARALSKVLGVRGRVEEIGGLKSYRVFVDYAHTPDSLTALYEAFPGKRKICVLGNTGGGRDTWKRPEMGRIAETFCETVIVTNEDPYDEDPRAIVDAMAIGMKKKRPLIIMNRRSAIAEALQIAGKGNSDCVVLISGKGTDPCICGPRGSKIPWDDATITREEIAKLGTNA